MLGCNREHLAPAGKSAAPIEASGAKVVAFGTKLFFPPTVSAIGGCSYEWAVWKACERAAAAGADGIHSIESSANTSGEVVSLRASAFVHLPPLVMPTATPTAAAPVETAEHPSIEERLRRLEKLKSDQLITPEEYAKKRAEILGEL